MRPHRLQAFLLLATLGATVVSCDHTPTDPSTVSATALPQGVRLVNSTSEPIYYTLPIHVDLLPLMDMVPCTMLGGGCPALPANSSVIIPWSAIPGEGHLGDYWMSWWHGAPFSADPRGAHALNVSWTGYALLRAPASGPLLVEQ